MGDAECSSLISKGVRQGTLFKCDALSTSAKQAIQNNRAIISKREKPVQDAYLLLVLSQDCDISNNDEEYLEVLTLKKVPDKAVTPVIQKTRNTRKLQLLFDNGYWLCDANLISHVPKELILKEDLVHEGALSPQSKEILLQWRINRYSREPLPDNFNRAFIAGYLRDEGTGFSALLQDNKDYITDLYAFVSPQDDKASEYLVSVTALLSDDCPTDKAADIKTTLESHINNIHRMDNCLKMIQVETSLIPDNHETTLDIVAEPADFSMLDAYGMKRLTIDYLCWPEEAEPASKGL